MTKPDYSKVTEVPGVKASSEQIERLVNRYKFAEQFCENKDVLEVACGSGQGLGYLAKKSKRVVGVDVEPENLKYAQDYYKDRNKIELQLMDAHQLKFEANSFDVVILYEAIYYLEKPDRFINEAFRVLRKNGILIIGTVNK